MNTYKISVIPGDGIGHEVTPVSLQVLDTIGAQCGFSFDYTQYDYSCEYYKENGTMMPDDAIERLSDSDAIFLGAVGYPGVPDHISLWGLLIPIRRAFQQYVNLRPVKLMKGIQSPLRNPGDIDFLIVRENNEGEYSQVGGRMHAGTEMEMAVQESIFTKIGVDRVMNYAYKLAQSRAKDLVSATKSNGIFHSMPFWDERFRELGKKYSDVTTSEYHIDILSAHMITRPDSFDVIVASNLFGDILSDLGPAAVGGMGIAPGANLNPEKQYPSMFEPVHGSAPDIAGKNIANPIAMIWTGAMMLDHLGEKEGSKLIVNAIETVVAEGKVLTGDLGGNASTQEVAHEIISKLGK